MLILSAIGMCLGLAILVLVIGAIAGFWQRVRGRRN